MRRKMSSLATGAAVLLLLAGCTVHVPEESKLVFRYAEGIWNIHQPTYQNMYLACHPDEPNKDLRERLKAYEEVERKKPPVKFAADGIEVIRLGALGNGAYFQVHDSASSGDVLRFKTVLKPGYLSINFVETPPNAILYLLGEPLGSVVTLKPGGKTHGPERSVLDSIDLAWTWSRLPPGSPSEWCLQSVEPVPGSAVFKKLTFREIPWEPVPASP